MMDNYTKEINYVDKSDKQLMSKLTDIFLKVQKTVVALDDERFIFLCENWLKKNSIYSKLIQGMIIANTQIIK